MSTAPRLGEASIVISISDKEGILVKHGTDGTILAMKPAQCCKTGDWGRIWRGIEKSGVQRVVVRGGF